MTTLNTMEGNKLIAEFDGLIPSGNAILDYNRYWNLFMPVFKKFKQLTGDTSFFYATQLELITYIQNAICDVNIEEAARRLSVAITWYNSLTNKKEV